MANPFDDDPDLYDFPRMNGTRCPLLTDVSGAASPRKWDEKQGQGLSGATLVFTGEGLAKPVLRFFAWKSEHFVAWEIFRPIIATVPTKNKSAAISIEHPFLNELGCAAVVIEEEGMWTQASPGLFTKDMKCSQYRAPKPAGAKPQGAGWKEATENKKSAADKTIDDLTKQVKALGG